MTAQVDYTQRVQQLAHRQKWLLPFTKSNGTTLSRIYERLTKQSRRDEDRYGTYEWHAGYRRGVYETLKALQEELS